jgi:hypothetical protein
MEGVYTQYQKAPTFAVSCESLKNHTIDLGWLLRRASLVKRGFFASRGSSDVRFTLQNRLMVDLR